MEQPGGPQYVKVRAPSVSPIVTYVLMGVCILVYLGQMAGQYILGFDLLAGLGAKVNEAILEGQLWRMVTPMFLHGSLMHIAFNMYALYNLGRGLERSYGHFRFLLLFLFGGVAGNLASFALTPSGSLGASTAIFGLLAAEGIFFYQNRRLLAGQASRAISQIISIALVNLFIGFTVPQIDNWGHIGGLLGGAAFAWIAGPLLQVEGTFPNLELTDQRGLRLTWLAATGLGFLLALFTALLILFK
jgi:rhomboid protease GluP